MLGCACGGLLANVFLHLLPEAMTLAGKAAFERARLLHERAFLSGGCGGWTPSLTRTCVFWSVDNSEEVLLGHRPHQLTDPHVVSGLFVLAGICFFFGLEKVRLPPPPPAPPRPANPTHHH